MANAKPITLLRSFFAFSASVAILMVACIATFVYMRSDDLLDSTLDTAVRMRTQSAATSIARSLYQDWESLRFLSTAIRTDDPDAIHTMMQGIQGDGTRIAWVGYAGLDGRIRVSGDHRLVDVDVQARPWFQQGIDIPYGGDLHPAVLLAPNDPNALFIDLARPVHTPDGMTNGVVAFHIHASWLQRHLTETADSLNIDLFLINPTGTVSMASNGDANSLVDSDIARIAQTGASMGVRETWDDGRSYFSTVVTDVTYGDLPNFGWRLVGRIDTGLVHPVLAALQEGALWLIAITSGLAITLSALYARLILVPLTRLAGTAHRIRTGSQEYVPPYRSTDEARTLATALLALQQAKSPPPES